MINNWLIPFITKRKKDTKVDKPIKSNLNTELIDKMILSWFMQVLHSNSSYWKITLHEFMISDQVEKYIHTKYGLACYHNNEFKDNFILEDRLFEYGYIQITNFKRSDSDDIDRLYKLIIDLGRISFKEKVLLKEAYLKFINNNDFDISYNQFIKSQTKTLILLVNEVQDRILNRIDSPSFDPHNDYTYIKVDLYNNSDDIRIIEFLHEYFKSYDLEVDLSPVRFMDHYRIGFRLLHDNK